MLKKKYFLNYFCLTFLCLQNDYQSFTLRNQPNNVHILQACCQFFMFASLNNRGDIMSADNRDRLYTVLKPNLSSSAHLVRILTLKILAAFDKITLTAPEEVNVQYSISFQMIWKADLFDRLEKNYNMFC